MILENIVCLNSNFFQSRCRNGVIEQLKLAKCSVTITPDTWWMPQPIAIKATKDFKYDGNRPRTIEFKMTDGPGRSIWDGYIPHPVQVRSCFILASDL